MKCSKSRHLCPIVFAILIVQIQGLDADNYQYNEDETDLNLLRINDLIANDLEDNNEDVFFGRQQRSLFHQPRVDRSNLQVPYPRMGKRNDGRTTRYSKQDANYVVPMARVGRGDPSSMIPMARIGRSDPSSMIPIARIGRALNEGYEEDQFSAREARSNMIPIARLGRRSDDSMSMIPLARIGRSQTNNAMMIPMARIGRSVGEVTNSIIPMARIGRSNTKAAMIPMARIGRSSSGEEMMPVFLPSDDFRPGTFHFATGSVPDSNPGLQQQNGFRSGNA